MLWTFKIYLRGCGKDIGTEGSKDGRVVLRLVGSRHYMRTEFMGMDGREVR